MGSVVLFEWKHLRVPILAAAISSLLTLLYGVASYEVINDENGPVSEIFSRWDSVHYAAIAEQGYVQDTEKAYRICFFPLFPFLAAPIAHICGDATIALLIIANLACIAACVVFYRLVEMDFDSETALRSVFAMLVFPTAYFLHVGYTESLFLATSIAALLFARRNMWVAAGLLAILATLTRMTGLALLPALVVEYLHQRQFRLSKVRWSALLTLSPLAGLGIYLLINIIVSGNAFEFLHQQSAHFSRKVDWPWVGLVGDLGGLVTARPSIKLTVSMADIVALVLSTVAIAWSAWKLRPCYTIYAAGIWILTFCYSFWLSVPRLVLPIFPMFIMFAVLTKGRPVLQFSLGFASILCYGLGLQHFVRGWWSY